MARRVSRMRLEADDWICVAALVSKIADEPVDLETNS